MFNLFSIRTNYWKNGTQFMGKWTARVMGTTNFLYLPDKHRGEQL